MKMKHSNKIGKNRSVIDVLIQRGIFKLPFSKKTEADIESQQKKVRETRGYTLKERIFKMFHNDGTYRKEVKSRPRDESRIARVKAKTQNRLARFNSTYISPDEQYARREHNSNRRATKRARKYYLASLNAPKLIGTLEQVLQRNQLKGE